jgi:hypothetical protein
MGNLSEIEELELERTFLTHEGVDLRRPHNRATDTMTVSVSLRDEIPATLIQMEPSATSVCAAGAFLGIPRHPTQDAE